MPILEPVVATLVANITEFSASMEAAKAEMGGLSTDAAVAGEDVGGALSGGVAHGAKDAAAGL